MSHIDEGVLHAYLDGALDDFPVAEAERVREHLERCGACRVRLEEERALRARAQAILGMAAPEVDAPPLEELRARARHREAPARRSARARLTRVGWAASVILALGTGWLLRGGTGSVEPDAPRAAAPVLDSEVAQGDAEPGGQRLAEGAPALTNGSAPARGEASDAGATGPTVSEGITGPTASEREVPRVSGPDVGLLADVSLQRDVGSLAPLRPRPITTGSMAEVAGGVGDDDAADRTEVEVARRASDRGVVVTSASWLTPLAARTPPVPARTEREREEVDYPQGELYSLVVPGLELIEVRFRGEVRPEGQVVLQRLRSGDTLTIVHLPPGIDPATVEAAAPGELQVSVRRATGSILMRAPLSEDELLDLMERLLGAP